MLLPVSDQAAILQEVKSSRTEFEQFHEDANLQRACDRKRITALETTDLQPAHKDREKVLRAPLAANGCKMFAKDVRQKDALSRKSLFGIAFSHV